MKSWLVIGLGVGCLGWLLAPSPFDSCEVELAAGDRQQAAQCFYTTAKEASLWGEAARRLDLHLRTEDDPWLTLAQAKILWRIDSRWEEIGPLCRRAAHMLASRGDATGQVDALGLLARWLRSSEQLEESAAVIAAMVRVAEASGDPAILVRAGIEEASHLRSSGSLSRAAAVLDDIETDAATLGWRRAWLSARYRISYELGRFDDTLALIDELFALLEAEGDPAVTTRLNGIKVMLALEPPSEAFEEEIRQRLQEVLELAVASDDGVSTAEASFLLGRLEGGAEGRVHLERCIASEKVLGLTTIQIRCRAALAAQLAAVEGERDDQLLAPALDVLTTRDNAWRAIYLGNELKEALWTLRPRQEVMAIMAKLLADIETLRAEQAPGAERAELMSVWSEIHYWLSGHLLASYLEAPERHTLRQAFDLMELLRARLLREEVGHAQGSAPPDTQRSASLSPVSLAPISLDALEASVGVDEALLIFQTAPDVDLYSQFAGGSWVWVVTRGATKVIRIPAESLRTSLEMLLDQEDPSQDVGLLTLLGRQLLGEARAALPPQVERLVLVPDGPLHRLPFALLRDGSSTSPLVERFTISVAPSATLWHHWRQHPGAGSGGPALVFADPLLAAASGGRGERSVALEQLPHARPEALAVRRHLQGSRLLVGANATEQLLKSLDLGPYDVLHFAAHAVVGSGGSEDAAVVLAAEGSEDGALTPAEIVRLDLRGKLVVLSTCDSHRGRLLRGEGVMSLARAFFAAGASTVVATLGRLPDAGAAVLFERFYSHLAAGGSVAEALTAAQREARRKGLPAAAWAQPVVLGNGDLVPFPAASPLLASTPFLQGDHERARSNGTHAAQRLHAPGQDSALGHRGEVSGRDAIAFGLQASHIGDDDQALLAHPRQPQVVANIRALGPTPAQLEAIAGQGVLGEQGDDLVAAAAVARPRIVRWNDEPQTEGNGQHGGCRHHTAPWAPGSASGGGC